MTTKVFLYDGEVAKFYRVSVKTILNQVKLTGQYNGITPRVVGGGDKRKYRLWKISDIAERTGISEEQVANAAVM